MNLSDLEKQVRNSKRLVLASIILLPLGYFIWFFLIKNEPLSTSSESWGTFGDFIGGILNPVIALSAFYWLVNSVIIQKTELEATKKTLEASERAQREQADTLALQRFDETFFALLAQHNTVLNNLTSKPPQDPHMMSTPKSVIQYAHRQVFSADTIAEARTYLESLNSTCGHYFRVVYQILKYIATKCPGTNVGNAFDNELLKNKTSEEEKFYANVLRSFLSYEVTQLLAINCCVEEQSDTYCKYRLLIERYSFLEHMPFTTNYDAIDRTLIETKKIYRSIAFGNSEFTQDFLN